MVAVHCAFDEMMPIESVIPNPRNPNTHPDKQIKLLAKIINTQGWRAPITVSKRSGFIVRGHGRLLAAQLLNLETVPVDLQDYESEAAEWADLIADNRLAELATIDDSLPTIWSSLPVIRRMKLTASWEKLKVVLSRTITLMWKGQLILRLKIP